MRATLYRLWPSLFLLTALLARPSGAEAHQLDEYLQATLVKIEANVIRLQMNLTPGVAVADRLLATIDSDADGVISAKEAAAYAESLRRDLVVRLDDRELRLKATVADFPAPDELRTGWGIIQLEFSTEFDSLPSGSHRLTIRNQHQHRISVYLLNAALPEAGLLEITGQKRNFNQSSGEIEFQWHPPASSAKPANSAKTLILWAVAVFVVLGAGWAIFARNVMRSDTVERPARHSQCLKRLRRAVSMKAVLLVVATILPVFLSCSSHRALIGSGVTPSQPVVRRTAGGGCNVSYGPEKCDPLENDPRYRLAFEDATRRADLKLAKVPHKLGFVHLFWQTKKQILRERYGIDWKTPSELNPYSSYD